MTAPTLTIDELRAHFGRRGTPDQVVLARAAQARRLRVGPYSPEALRYRAEWARWERESLELARRADEALAEAFRTGQVKVLVGVAHPTPLSALEDGQGILCEYDCCNGQLPTQEQNHLDIVAELRAQLRKAWRRGEDEEARDILATLKAAGEEP